MNTAHDAFLAIKLVNFLYNKCGAASLLILLAKWMGYHGFFVNGGGGGGLISKETYRHRVYKPVACKINIL